MTPSSILSDRSVQTFQPTQKAFIMSNLPPGELIREALKNGEGQLADNGALVCMTGRFRGRVPKDRFLVRDETTRSMVEWNDINQPFDADMFDKLHERMLANLANRTVYVRDAYAGTVSPYRLRLRVMTTLAWHSLFSHHIFADLDVVDSVDGPVSLTVLVDPSFTANPAVDGTRQPNFTIINLTKGIILIGGTSYAGELKKAVFTVLNYWLPLKHGVLPMHSAANVGKDGDTALFFGLAGTGKTTLSADPARSLIGDDEHGWARSGSGSPAIFNLESGCYAKVLHLDPAQEPLLFSAIKAGAILENTPFLPNSTSVDYADSSLTENTRCTYPLHHIPSAVIPSEGSAPRHVFFLTADAFGVLPPIARLTSEQALDYFLLGYSARIAGTEQGITTPMATFSPCFGAAFLPLPARTYAKLLKERLDESGAQVWLINTGWKGGSFGIGKRMALPHTRAMISAVLTGALDEIPFQQHTEFGLAIPTACPGVPTELLNPIDTWAYKAMYRSAARRLANAFTKKLTEL